MIPEYKIIKGPVYKKYIGADDDDYVTSVSMMDINSKPLRPFDILVLDYDEEQLVYIQYGPEPEDKYEVGNIYEALAFTDSPEGRVIAETLLKKGEARWRKRGE